MVLTDGAVRCFELLLPSFIDGHQRRFAEGEKMKSAPLLVTTTDAATAIGCRRTKFLELLKEGHFETLTIGRRRMIVWTSIEAYVARLRAEQGQEPAEKKAA